MASSRKAQRRMIQSVASRKKRRKRQREAKKQRKALYHSRSAAQQILDEKNEVAEEDSSFPSTSNIKQSLGKKKSIKKAKQVKRPRSSVMAERDKKEIVKMERLLKINSKGSTKKLPNSFREDGLDYVLNITDSYNEMLDLSEEEEEDDSDGDSDYQIDEEELRSAEHNILKRRPTLTKQVTNLATPPYGTVVGGILKSAEKERIKSVVLKKVMFDPEEEEDESGLETETLGADGGGMSAGGKGVSAGGKGVRTINSEGMKGEEEEEALEEFQELDDSYFEIESIESLESDDEWEVEDEYGGGGEEEEMSEEELMEEKCGADKKVKPSMDEETTSTAMTVAEVSKYVPPQMREKGILQRLTKKVQGLINRLSESNMKSISCELESLYREASRNEMNVTLWGVLEKACAGPSLMSDKFAMEQAMLVAILHHHVGTEVGAYMVQCLAVQLAEQLWSGQECMKSGKGKKAEGLLLLLAHLYNYKVVHCLLVYDVIRKLVDSFMERNIEMLLLLLKNVGMEIRRDDPGSLKAVILQIQSKARTSELSTTPRVKFMLETISALKTNNARKIPNYDPSLFEHMKKLLRGLLRSPGSLDDAQLKVSLDDLLNADKQGRWWVVGSAWTGRDTGANRSEGVSLSLSAAISGEVSETWILGVARHQHMNTDLRKTVFGVMMTSEDYVDCFQKLIKLGLTDVQEREIVHVLVDCCLQEKHFNPYYVHLAQKLCEVKKAHQVTFQYSLWDRFKVLDSLTPSNLTNLRQLTFHLITKKALSLSILKVVEFTELSVDDIKFFKDLLHSILTEVPKTVVQQVFSRIAPLPNLKKLRDNLLVFIRHYFPSKKEEKDNSLLGQRLTLVEHVLRAEPDLF